MNKFSYIEGKVFEEALLFVLQNKTIDEWMDWIEDFANESYDFLNENERTTTCSAVGDAEFFWNNKEDHDMMDVVESMKTWMRA